MDSWTHVTIRRTDTLRRILDNMTPERRREWLAAADAVEAESRSDAEKIQALRREAEEAGNDAQAELCVAALDGDRGAWSRCLRAIQDARAAAWEPS